MLRNYRKIVIYDSLRVVVILVVLREIDNLARGFAPLVSMYLFLGLVHMKGQFFYFRVEYVMCFEIRIK